MLKKLFSPDLTFANHFFFLHFVWNKVSRISMLVDFQRFSFSKLAKKHENAKLLAKFCTNKVISPFSLYDKESTVFISLIILQFLISKNEDLLNSWESTPIAEFASHYSDIRQSTGPWHNTIIWKTFSWKVKGHTYCHVFLLFVEKDKTTSTP